MDDRQYRLSSAEENGRTGDEDDVPMKREKEDDSPLVFEFLKRKKPMPSARRLDYML
jgi:hypothetical protein